MWLSMIIREGTLILVIVYAVYLVFEGLSLRACSRAIRPFAIRSHKSVWMWMQELVPLEAWFKARRARLFLIDETMERAVQSVKDRTETFDDYFPCRKKGRRLQTEAYLELDPRILPAQATRISSSNLPHQGGDHLKVTEPSPCLRMNKSNV